MQLYLWTREPYTLPDGPPQVPTYCVSRHDNNAVIFETLIKEEAEEIVKRVNQHEALVAQILEDNKILNEAAAAIPVIRANIERYIKRRGEKTQ